MSPRAWTSTTQTQLIPKKNKTKEVSAKKEFDPSILKLFLKIRMKFLRDQKYVEGLQELIDNYVDKEEPKLEQRKVNKIYRNKKRVDK